MKSNKQDWIYTEVEDPNEHLAKLWRAIIIAISITILIFSFSYFSVRLIYEVIEEEKQQGPL